MNILATSFGSSVSSITDSRVGRPASNGHLPIAAKLADGAGADQPPSEAYEQTLRTLCLVDRSDPLTELIAKKIIEIGQTGVKEPAQISELAIKDLGIA